MTRPSQKQQERLYVEQAAKLLGKTWALSQNDEHPDFLVTEGEQRFGLEVSLIFTGERRMVGKVDKGFHSKEMESRRQGTIDALRLSYEAISNTPLSVKFVGNISSENLATVVPALAKMDLAAAPIGSQYCIDEGNGLRVHLTRAFRPQWIYVNDGVGWVDNRSLAKITDAVAEKAENLPLYRATAGTDIRLLIVADRMKNSGKLTLGEGAAVEFQGFQAVYFFSYPESVTILNDASGRP